MDKDLVSDELWRIVEPLLLTKPSKAGGGRPRIPNRAVLSGIAFVLKVERTLAWVLRYRRLAPRYERRADIHQAFLHLGSSLICLNHLP